MAKKERWTAEDSEDPRSVASAAALRAFERKYGQMPVRTAEETALLEVAAAKGEENAATTR